MKRASVLRAALVVASAIVTAAPAAAQVTAGADLGLFSDYVWRGITLTNRFALQPDAYLTIPAGKASITLGGWANAEPGQYDGDDDIGQGAGASSFDLTEFDWWGEVGFPVGEKTTLTAGTIGYVFPNDVGATDDFNTVELYGKAAFAVPLSPKLGVWYDVDKIKGAYFEGSLSHTIQPPDQKFSVVLGALAGLSAGQGLNEDDEEELSNFADDGFTHLDLSAAVPFIAGPLSISPAVHLVITGDDATKRTSPSDLDNDVKFWFGGTISWSKALGAAAEE